MKNLDLSVVRKIVCELVEYDFADEVKEMSEEEFLNCWFEDDLGFDSLDMICVSMHIERETGLSLDPDNEKMIVNSDCTVRKFIEEFNKYLN